MHAWQVFAGLQIGFVGSEQSAELAHATQRPACAPMTAQAGVAAERSRHAMALAEGAVHATHVPVASQIGAAGSWHSAELVQATQAPEVPQNGRNPPHCSFVEQGTHVPVASHIGACGFVQSAPDRHAAHAPESAQNGVEPPHCSFAVQGVHMPLAALQIGARGFLQSAVARHGVGGGGINASAPPSTPPSVILFSAHKGPDKSQTV